MIVVILSGAKISYILQMNDVSKFLMIVKL
jgi:hypothetical protein